MNKPNETNLAKTVRRIRDKGWKVRELPRPNVPAHMLLPALPAQVPGYVHLDLMRNDVIEDPFKDMNEKSLAWIDETDWEYRTVFQVAERKPGATFLLFEGLDTIAEISLNGEHLAFVDNMHQAHEFNVTEKLRCGEGELGDNELIVTFRSAVRIGRERHAAWNAAGEPTMPEHWDLWGARSFVRKAQYMFGWDWGPVMPSCGIFKQVSLVNVPVARITNWTHEVEFTETGKAIVTVEVDIERTESSNTDPLSVTLALEPERRAPRGVIVNWRPYVPEGFSTATQVGASHFVKRFEIDEPQLWWPNGLDDGRHTLYILSVKLGCRGKELDSTRASIGLRTIELIREPDADGKGESFRFRVNGVDLFAKGANWIPAYSFPNTYYDETKYPITRRSYESTVRTLLGEAYMAGVNMLRVWGGGFYESDEFYETCDKYGILVWQDFPFACAYYPDNDDFCDQIRAEATENVRRIRHHASLALWCGNNENQMMEFDSWAGSHSPRFLGERLYNDILPAVVATENPQTPYWPGSPFGSGAEGENPNGPDFGDRHNWDVWHGVGDWTHYTADNARFVSEFGFASSCGLAAWKKYISEDQQSPYSQAIRWHDKTRKGYDTYFDMVQLHFPKPRSLEDLVYYTQLNQAEALKYGIEHYRRLKGRCWGTLFWQLNDCWPAHSWSVIDSMGEPKAAWWAMRQFYAPLLVSLVREGESVAVHMVSDKQEPIYGTLTITLQHFDGSILARCESEVELGANSSTLVENFGISEGAGLERETVVRAVFVCGDGTRVENALLLAEPKDLRVADPGIRWRVEHDGAWLLHLTAERFAPYVWLRLNDNAQLNESLGAFQYQRGAELSLHVREADNYFHLYPGETKTVGFPGDLRAVEQNLTMRWL